MSPLKGKWLFPVSGAFRRVGPGRLHGETRFLLPGLVPVSQPALPCRSGPDARADSVSVVVRIRQGVVARPRCRRKPALHTVALSAFGWRPTRQQH
jgi:hypothetical protein